MAMHPKRKLPPGASWQRRVIPILLAAALSSCSVSRKPEEPPEREVKSSGLTMAELDQLARNYSDRLVIRVSSVCDQIKQEVRDDKEAFAKAHELKLTVALAAYDIMTNQGETAHMPGAIQRVLNLLILTQLQAIKWIEEDEGRKAFGEQGGEQLNVALINSWQDLGALASRVIEPEQLDRLTTMVVNWRHENPDAEWLTSVRLDKIAQVEEGEAFVKSVGEGFAPPESTRRAVEELHLIAQQELFYLKRMPILLDWALEASLGSLTVVPKSSAGSGTIQGADVMLVDGFESVEGLPRCASQMIAVTEAIARAADHREIPGRKGTAVPVENRLRNEASLGAEAERSSLPSRMDASARQPIAQAQDSRELPAVVTRKNVDAVSNRSEPKVSGETLDVTNHMTWRVLMLVLLAVLLEVLRVVVRRIHRSGAPPTPIS